VNSAKFDLSKIKFSWTDKRKKIKLPEMLTEELAEDIGIHIGDGSMYLTGPNLKSYEMRYSGDSTEDKEHYINRIIPLKERLFNKQINGKILNFRGNEYGFVICSKAIFYFYTKIIHIPSGTKTKIAEVPKMIMKSNKSIQAAFIRGLSDTDFSLTFKRKSTKHNLNYYPMITANFASRKLVDNLQKILKGLSFNVVILDGINKRYNKHYPTHIININGKRNLELWMKIIGFNNPKHLTKYLVWKKFGFCPPRLSLKQRKQILTGNLDPYNFY